MGRIQFLLRCMFRHGLRTNLTMLSLVTAFMLFIMLRSVAVVFETGFDAGPQTRMQTASKYSMVDMLPLAHMNVIRSIEGVTDVTHASWFGGFFEEGETNVATFAVDPETYFDVYSDFEIDPNALEEFKSIRTAALAPQGMIERYGWEIGQKISVVSTIYPAPSEEGWVFDLVGSFESTNESDGFDPFLFHHDVLRETFAAGAVGWYTFLIDDPERADVVAQVVDRRFKNSSDETRTMTESDSWKSFLAQYGDISLMMTGILGAVFFTMILLTANTMVQGYRERVPELAVMKTLGFSNLSVSMYILVEALLLCGISAALGVGLGTLVSMGAQDFMPPMIPIYFDPITIIWGLILGLALGLFVGLVPAVNANRLEIVEALHAH